MFDHVVDFFGFQGQFTRRCYFLPRFSAEPKNCAELPSSSSTDVAGSKEAWRIVFASEMARNWKSSWRNWLRNWLQLVWISQLSPSGGASEKLRHSRKIVGNLMWQWIGVTAVPCCATPRSPRCFGPRPVHTLVYEDGEEAKLLQWTQPQPGKYWKIPEDLRMLGTKLRWIPHPHAYPMLTRYFMINGFSMLQWFSWLA